MYLCKPSYNLIPVHFNPSLDTISKFHCSPGAKSFSISLDNGFGCMMKRFKNYVLLKILLRLNSRSSLPAPLLTRLTPKLDDVCRPSRNKIMGELPVKIHEVAHENEPRLLVCLVVALVGD